MAGLLNHLQNHRHTKSRLIAPHPKYPKGFVLVENHYELSLIQEFWNRGINSEAFDRWCYWYTIGNMPVGGPYADLRLCRVGERYVTPRSTSAQPPYFVPAGLQQLEDLMPYGFAADYHTCSVCDTPLGEHHERGFVGDTLYCPEHLPMAEYVAERINNSTHIVDPVLVDLEQHEGEYKWTLLPLEFGDGRFTIPHDVLVALYPLDVDVIFSSIAEADHSFHTWISKADHLDQAMALVQEE